MLHIAAIENPKQCGPKDKHEQFKTFSFDYSYWSLSDVSTAINMYLYRYIKYMYGVVNCDIRYFPGGLINVLTELLK